VALVPDPAAGLAGRTALAIFAHPDDESLACGGTLARLADSGVRVVLMCASRGERGSLSDPALVPPGSSLAAVRANELREAARVLGAAEVIILDHPDGNIRWNRVTEFHAEIVNAIETYRPDVVITFDEDGLYWHFDHIGVHERTQTAVKSFGDAAPPLYYVTLPHGAMRYVVEAAIARGWVPPGSGFWAITPDAFGLAAEPHSLTVDVSAWVGRKLEALCCHRTQMGATNPFGQIDQAEAQRWLGHERFRRSEISSGESILDLIGEQVFSS
jgi:N-acetyl-1-D-myo-inositol-2-amino-2-deoxy-alpha-D-glucopyranoside deacetylase